MSLVWRIISVPCALASFKRIYSNIYLKHHSASVCINNQFSVLYQKIKQFVKIPLWFTVRIRLIWYLSTLDLWHDKVISLFPNLCSDGCALVRWYLSYYFLSIGLVFLTQKEIKLVRKNFVERKLWQKLQTISYEPTTLMYFCSKPSYSKYLKVILSSNRNCNMFM